MPGIIVIRTKTATMAATGLSVQGANGNRIGMMTMIAAKLSINMPMMMRIRLHRMWKLH